MPVYENASERRRLENLRNDPEVIEALIEAGAEVAEVMRLKAPKRTGALAESIDYELVRDPITGVEVRVACGKKIFYDWMVEAGTEHSPAQPFIRPTAAEYE